ncbi:hypothetical protein [Xanthomonas albilineans]|uniref:hypothetical protein n=1 Tax=Xanthomonas albilineans TaxID=29447 RepID=UPI0011B04B60|nr:hypothetical protein [Xanthomonas albilineans]
MNKRPIRIDQLDLDVSNFRLEAADTQEESVENMLEEQQQKLVNLSRDILENGLSPAEFLIVAPNPDAADRYVVYEGNRRLTALRLMGNPELARGTAFEGDYQALAERFRMDPITHVQCAVFEGRDDALLWIDRKHNPLNGRGLVQWGSPATDRRDEYKSGKVRPSRAILDHLRGRGLLTPLLEKNLRRRTTNLDRVFQMPYVRTRLGIVIDRKANAIAFASGDVTAGNALLLSMAEALGSKSFPVRHILEQDQRISFIDRFAEAAVLAPAASPAAPDLIDDPYSVVNPSLGRNGANGTTPDKGRPEAPRPQGKPMRPAPSTLLRTTLALRGKGYDLRIEDPRLNRLYEEARNLDPDGFPNTAALLMRVFLELSSEFYLTAKQIAIPARHSKSHWGDIGLSLELKIRTVLENLDPAGRDHELLSARQGISSSEHGHSVSNLHGYIHNRNADAEGQEVKRVWERWQPYFRRLFDALRTP